MQVDRIPVRIETAVDAELKGRLQLIDNQVDAASGTVRMRAVFDNEDGHLMPGQFVRLSMGEAQAKPALLISERPIATDQSKKFVRVVDDGNKAARRTSSSWCICSRPTTAMTSPICAITAC